MNERLKAVLTQPSLPMWIIAIALVVITVYALDLATSARKTLGATQQFYVDAQRPYVGVLVDFSIVGDHIHAHYTIKNFGKSPALHVKQRLMLVKDADVSDFFKKTDLGSIARETIIMPGPEDNPYADIYWPLPKAKAPKVKPTEKFVYAVGRIQYTDGSGAFYHTDFCFERLADGSSFYCGQHNAVE